MTLQLLYLFLNLSGAVPPVPAMVYEARHKACPAAAPDHAAYLRQFFAAPESRPFRQQYGLLGIRPGDVRLLTDEHDAETCRRMAQAVTLAQTRPYPKVWRGYRAGDFYIMMVTTQAPDGVLRHGGGNGLIILNRDMQVVAAAS